jgi:hypothetical protein
MENSKILSLTRKGLKTPEISSRKAAKGPSRIPMLEDVCFYFGNYVVGEGGFCTRGRIGNSRHVEVKSPEWRGCEQAVSKAIFVSVFVKTQQMRLWLTTVLLKRGAAR